MPCCSRMQPIFLNSPLLPLMSRARISSRLYFVQGPIQAVGASTTSASVAAECVVVVVFAVVKAAGTPTNGRFIRIKNKVFEVLLLYLESGHCSVKLAGVWSFYSNKMKMTGVGQ
ncbi:hypothetical protein TB1_037158 [Malus domestica]